MQSMLNTFVSMPMPLKIGLAVVTGGLAAALFLLPSSVLWVVFIGVGALGRHRHRCPRRPRPGYRPAKAQ